MRDLRSRVTLVPRSQLRLAALHQLPILEAALRFSGGGLEDFEHPAAKIREALATLAKVG